VPRFAISYSPSLGWLLRGMGLGPRHSGVKVTDATVEVRLGWGFRARFPRRAVARTEPYDGRIWAWGAHGWRGRWLVNGSSHDIVVVHLEPVQRAFVVGFPVKLRELAVSVEDRAGLLAALA
jgi:hypothetical protein